VIGFSPDVMKGFFLLFQFGNLGTIMALCFKMVIQVRTLKVSLPFLVNSYLSITILFAGIYLLIFNLDGISFTNVVIDIDITNEKALTAWQIFEVYIRLLYFSATTMTTVGYGDISPRTWYMCIIVIIQQVISFMFTTVLFGIGVAHFSTILK